MCPQEIKALHLVGKEPICNQFAEMTLMVTLSVIIIIWPSYTTFLEEQTVIKLIKDMHDYDVV